jgi:hypothetical protein
MTLATPDAPLILWGGFTVGAYADHHQYVRNSPLLISWVMNNHWHTNFRADQAGTMVLRYRLRLHAGGFDADRSQRVGLEAATPLLARVILGGEAGQVIAPPPGARPATASFLHILPEVAQILDCQEERTLEGRVMTLTVLPWTEVFDGSLTLGGPDVIQQAWYVSPSGEVGQDLVVQDGTVNWAGRAGKPLGIKIAIQE